MAFNKSLVVYATVNLEFQRENPMRWREWIDNIRRIAARPNNAVIANNAYVVRALFVARNVFSLLPFLVVSLSLNEWFKLWSHLL